VNSREKGAGGERELARILCGYGFEGQRGQQYSGANGDADVIGLPGIHIECKRVERLNLDEAMEQAVRDAYADSLRQGERTAPAVFHRKNAKRGTVRGSWKVTMLLEDWIKYYKAAQKHWGSEG